MDGFVAVGKQVPVIGAIFGILGDLKTQADLYVASSKECQRLSVWCVSQIGTIGRLAKEAAIDPETEKLLRAAVPPLLSLQTMVAKRLKATQGTVGKLMGFWTSGKYMRKSDMAQKCVQAAIDSLIFRVEVDTRIDVQKVRDKCDLLPVMDKKLDDLLGLAKESNDMMNEILLLNKKKTAKEQAALRKESSMAEWNIRSFKIKRDPEPFAKGATGEVFKGLYGRIPVAIKVMKLQGASRGARQKMQDDFAGEVSVLVMLRHPNVVNIYGIIDDDLQCLQLIMDFASGGDLRDFLKSDSSAGLSALEQLDLCNQIAHGMEYLHSKQVAHRDLKSLNVLMFIERTGERVPKISDFGLSKMDHGFTATATAAGPLGTPAWSAPEVLNADGAKPDPFLSGMWSFGVVVWEVTTRKMPWEGSSVMQILTEVGIKGKKLDIPQSAPPQIITVYNQLRA